MKSKPSKTIVLIEDEEVITNLLTMRLKQEGYEVKIAKEGAAGLELIRSSKPDLVLLDMGLPKMDGLEILEKLKDEKLLPKLPVIIISNSGQQVELDSAFALGIKDYFIKVNFDPEEIIAKVNYHFQARESQGQDFTGANLPRILLVEDEVLLIELMEKKLKESNFLVSQAQDAEEARQRLKAQRIDLVLLDLMLPGVN